MEGNQVYLINCVFGWVLMTLSMLGYWVTQKNLGQRWMAWVLLAWGWGLFAVAQTMLIIAEEMPVVIVIGLWLSSYVMVISAIVLLFLKLIRLRSRSAQL
jgi:ABC-type microcin C transport system permease subunit YejB